ncbi:MAG: sigma-54-dependent Fis family transcriptional regulator [Alphaproteobacteria bacterium]|nr:sigma-54-dependent Fis family transcriptional regulator [Alphaproteobacteria bacterium]
MSARVAVVDDEPRMARVLEMVLRRDGHEVRSWTDPLAFLAHLEAERDVDLLLTDLKMPGLDGVSLLQRARALEPELPVLLITAHGTVQTAIEAMKQGAYDYLPKPVDNEACRLAVRRALDHTRLARENRALRLELRERLGLDGVVAESPAMRRVLELARRAARSDATVLITGESGTGKEVVARAIHVQSERVGGPFEAVNCKALSAGVLESELFGHERGAFTGAERARPGLFERASGGTLLLDELGEVDADFQGKLLRVLQEGEVRRVGGDAARRVDVRVLAATNRDLAADIASGRFREDLYYRLAVIPIRIPPLRERREDIVPLARLFLQRAARAVTREIRGWGPEVESWLFNQDWPGNVRELENCVERGVVLAPDEVVRVEDLQLLPAASAGAARAGREEPLHAFLDRMTEARVRQALADAGGVRVEAARLLGVERTTLYRLMRRLGLD